MTEVRFKRLRENATVPMRGSKDAAGWDLYACINEPIVIEPHTTAKIPTGIATELPSGTFGGVVARSGLATKYGIRVCQGLAVIDSDYRGEWFVPLHNDTDETFTLNPYERIAQLIVIPYLDIKFTEVEELSDTVRGCGGFGSTGVM